MVYFSKKKYYKEEEEEASDDDKVEARHGLGLLRQPIACIRSNSFSSTGIVHLKVAV